MTGAAAGSRPPFPAGWRLRFDSTTRRTDGGRVLIGGTPLRVMRLSAAGARLVEAWEAGDPVGDGDGARRLARRIVDAAIAHPLPPSDRPPATAPAARRVAGEATAARAAGASADAASADGTVRVRSDRARSFGAAPKERAHPEPARTPAPADVTVVIPVLDDPAGLARTLARLGPVAEVIVVDDGSADPAAIARVAGARTGELAGSVERAEMAGAGDAAGSGAPGPGETAARGVRVLRHERTRGPAAARNTGWRAAATPVVAFVDAEVELEPGWLAALLAHLGDEAVDAVAPRVRSATGSGVPPDWLVAYEDTRSSLDLGPDPAPVRPGSRVPYVPTAALVVRRSALEEVGGFDEDLPVGEDVDLVWRLAAAGHGIRYEPAVRATHPCRPSAQAWLRQRFRYGTAAADLAQRHGAAVSPLHVSGWSAAAWGLVGLGHPLAGAALATGTTVALTPKLGNLGRPLAEAVRIAGLGNLYAGRAVADAVRRPWWPAAFALAVFHRRSRLPLLAAVVAPPLLERRARCANSSASPDAPPPDTEGHDVVAPPAEAVGRASVAPASADVGRAAVGPASAEDASGAAVAPRSSDGPSSAARAGGASRLGVVAYVALRLVDDVAYGTGVLAGCWRRRSASALRPAFTGPFRAED